jgi:hypothetical protein
VRRALPCPIAQLRGRRGRDADALHCDGCVAREVRDRQSSASTCPADRRSARRSLWRVSSARCGAKVGDPGANSCITSRRGEGVAISEKPRGATTARTTARLCLAARAPGASLQAW